MSDFYAQQGFYSYMTQQAGVEELSESRYNLTIGATLTWGFFLNYLLLQFVAPSLMNWLYAEPSRTSTFPILFLFVYFVLGVIGNDMVRSYNPVRCLIGYHLIAVPVGLLVSIATFSFDPELVTRAVLLTAIITLSMMIISTLFPGVFHSMIPTLGVSLGLVVVVELFYSLFFRTGSSMLDWIVVATMSGYIGYDWMRANSVQRTSSNAIAAASALYLDIINIFLRLQRILARSRKDD